MTNCGECKFFVQGKPGKERYGTCHANPPVYCGRRKYQDKDFADFKWPAVDAESTYDVAACGRGEPK